MNLLFLMPQLPWPPDQGTKLRNFHLLRLAARAGHQVDLLTFTDAAGMESSSLQELGAWCRRIQAVEVSTERSVARRLVTLIGTSTADLRWRLHSTRFARKLKALLAGERYDVVQIEGLEMAPYLACVRDSPAVFDDHNVEYMLQRSVWLTDRRDWRRVPAALYSYLQVNRLRRWERQVCRSAAAVLAVSASDSALLTQLSHRPVRVVPNGIDLPAVPFREPPEAVSEDLLFDGTMSFRPNDDAARWLCDEIVPRVRVQHPGVRCWIVGRSPSSRLVAHNFAANGVAVTGTVPSTERYWRRAAIYVLPMRMGGGVRFKALEAMARGLPLVSTALGVEGTDARAGEHYLRAERPDEFADAIHRLFGDAALRKRLARAARARVVELDWERIAPGYLELLEELSVNQSAASRPSR